MFFYAFNRVFASGGGVTTNFSPFKELGILSRRRAAQQWRSRYTKCKSSKRGGEELCAFGIWCLMGLRGKKRRKKKKEKKEAIFSCCSW
ncbi:hypothetical protein CDL12_04263 [Handroanthus impetiginosus]|uniref:Uncharacterized protein n=1 Tax=Handroanthus impetiginosus TaxID=429701 RepID=A0A2G9HZS9_9LAMI|nr:hypothetical protein CDL12_04263 [Handroanthus impetiginosus]